MSEEKPPEKPVNPLILQLRQNMQMLPEAWKEADEGNMLGIGPLCAVGGLSLSSAACTMDLIYGVLTDPSKALHEETRAHLEMTMMEYARILEQMVLRIRPLVKALASKEQKILLPDAGGGFKPKLIR